jgi:1-acyl-sn-glycerol-3-phosphate acyltransferase
LLLLSQTTTTLEQPRNGNGTRPYPRMLPQWFIELCRPVIWLLCRLLWRVRWTNRENIPATGGLIVASNHQTYIDPVWISCPIKRPVRYLAWDAAFSWPIVGWWLRMLGSWPLQLEGSDPKPIRRSIQWLREGGVVVIFPEGGRGDADATMRKFKPGAARMAIEAGVPILPVTIRGGHRVWPTGFRFPRLGRVEVIYHSLFMLEQEPAEEARAYARRATEQLQEIIRGELEEPANG